jgi:hypothetical protein
MPNFTECVQEACNQPILSPQNGLMTLHIKMARTAMALSAWSRKLIPMGKMAYHICREVIGQLDFSLCLRPAAHREPQDAWQRWSPPVREAGSRAIAHAAALEPSPEGNPGLEPSLVGRRSLEPLDTWHPRSPPWQGGKVRYCRARGDAWMHVPLSVLT